MFSEVEFPDWMRGGKRKENKGYRKHYGNSAENVGVYNVGIK